MRSTTPDDVTFSAIDRCESLTAVCEPQCILTTTNSAPIARAFVASAMIRSGSISAERQSSPLGVLSPL